MFHDRSPIYQQIAEHMADEILSGTLRGGERVPSTHDYSAFFEINPATVGKAFQQLINEGLLFKKRGIGMFVSPEARQELLRQRRETFFAELVDPVIAQAEAIGIPLSEVVRHIEERTEGER